MPRRSAWSTTAWPAIVSTTPPATTRTVSSNPLNGGRTTVLGQSSHQIAIIAITGRAKVDNGPSTNRDRSGPPHPIPSATAAGSTSIAPASPRAGCPASRVSAISGRLRRGIHDELGRERQPADPPPGGVEHRVGDRRRHAHL